MGIDWNSWKLLVKFACELKESFVEIDASLGGCFNVSCIALSCEDRTFGRGHLTACFQIALIADDHHWDAVSLFTLNPFAENFQIFEGLSICNGEDR